MSINLLFGLANSSTIIYVFIFTLAITPPFAIVASMYNSATTLFRSKHEPSRSTFADDGRTFSDTLNVIKY